MKNYFLITILLSASCFLNACKKEPDATSKTYEADTTVMSDTTRLKKGVEMEKEKLAKPYKEMEDAQEALDKLIMEAHLTGKQVFVQAGGNWCIWCLRFNDFIEKDSKIQAIIDANYLYYHLNYSTKNKNKAVFDRYAPEGKNLGYPFFFIIDGSGTVTALLESGDLESGKSYDSEKVQSLFLEHVKPH